MGHREWTAKFAKGPTPGGSWTPSAKKTAHVTSVLEKALNESGAVGLSIVDEADCLKWVSDMSWHRLRPGGLYSFEQDGCHRSPHSDNRFLAPDSSATGWARSMAANVAMGELAEGAQSVFFHKNLIVAQRRQTEKTIA